MAQGSKLEGSEMKYRTKKNGLSVCWKNVTTKFLRGFQPPSWKKWNLKPLQPSFSKSLYSGNNIQKASLKLQSITWNQSIHHFGDDYWHPVSAVNLITSDGRL
jgi:hypothetical protein